MVELNELYNRFQDLIFISFAQTVKTILSAYEIIDITINRIVDKIDKGENGPFYVYRRAVILCNNDGIELNISNQAYGSMPLVIVLQQSGITLHNNQIGSIRCEYKDLCNHLDYLKPLYEWDINKSDHYQTLELETLVESLYRQLKLDDNEEDDVRNFIFSLLYIAHFKSLLDLDCVTDCLKVYTSTDDCKLSDIFEFFLNKRCPYITSEYPHLVLSKEAYKYIFAIIRFDTSLIDAEILTSLIYYMANKEDAGLYGHQTSFVNVEKVLQPLFLDKMQRNANMSTNENVYQVVTEIYDTVIFDPTNSPGCYLVASYNGLLQQLRDIETQFDISCNKPLDITQFVALVDNDLAADLTKLGLTFVHTKELNRLRQLSFDRINCLYNRLNVRVGNQLMDDWSKIISPNEFTYIVGSPQFKGCNKLDGCKKSAMQKVYGTTVLNNADYCSAWLVKAARFINGNHSKAAFVLTNSISQGSQATNLLNKINELGCEYIYAYRSFKWKMTSRDNVGVTVVIVGISEKGLCQKKYVYDDTNKVECNDIGAYLLPDIDIRIKKRSNAKGPISKILPSMRKGNMPDGAANILTFNSQGVDDFLNIYPDAKPYIKPLYGGDEFVSGEPSWCLWITKDQLQEALQIEGIRKRVEEVRMKREHSTSGKKSKENPYAFREQNVTSEGKVSIVVPCVTSENREYFQIGILDSNAIVNNNVNVIFDCDIWVLALLESRMHLVWAKNAAGGHESRPRYSSELCYNTFPAPHIDKRQKAILGNLARTLLEVREKYCNRSLGDMYKEMPPELIRVHQWIDRTVDSLYRSQPFESDGERLIWLKNIYDKLIENE